MYYTYLYNYMCIHIYIYVYMYIDVYIYIWIIYACIRIWSQSENRILNTHIVVIQSCPSWCLKWIVNSRFQALRKSSLTYACKNCNMDRICTYYSICRTCIYNMSILSSFLSIYENACSCVRQFTISFMELCTKAVNNNCHHWQNILN
jgi:hypothetical protein